MIELVSAYETELLNAIHYEVDVTTPLPGTQSMMFRLEDYLQL
jgi:hypothetical protein